MAWLFSFLSALTFCNFHPGENSGPITRDLMFFLSPFFRTLSRTGTCCSGVLLSGLFMGELFGFSIGQLLIKLSAGKDWPHVCQPVPQRIVNVECFHGLSLLVPLCSVDHL